jgi:hypothetical protein
VKKIAIVQSSRIPWKGCFDLILPGLITRAVRNIPGVGGNSSMASWFRICCSTAARARRAI